ncbi:uncharacterized protein LOC142353114 [Convolutriloba macropyga]|uniref:uncharacterized protein LOC142353114 n=1 Tax=Convolutriloba macropyga TaxID=536237 RepID=UPI003F5242BC
MPKKENFRYEIVVPENYSTFFCIGSSVWREEPKKRSSETDLSESLLLDYLEAVYKISLENSTCVPHYESGTLFYKEFKTLPDGTELNGHQEKLLSKYSIAYCKCRE